MNIEMAGQTVREHLELALVVRLSMTGPTIRNLPVLLMTHTTGHLAVFANRALPLAIDFAMTAATGLYIGIDCQPDLQRVVNLLMTRGTS